MRISLILFFTLFFISSMMFSQTESERGNIKLIPVRDDIYMLQKEGGNIGLCFGDDGIFMIDDEFGPSTSAILKQINSISKKDVQFLVNTHHHGDHTGGNINMANEGAIIFAHENVRQRLQARIDKATKEDKKLDEKILPIVTFGDDLNFYYNDEEIQVFHVENAHTDGDALVYFKRSNVLHSGDVFFKSRYPYIDLSSGGSVKGYIQALEKVFELIDDDTKIIPGHGDIATKTDMRISIGMLNRLYKTVAMHYLDEKDIDFILSIEDFTKTYDDRGFGDFYISREKILRTMYEDVVKEYSKKK